MSDSKRQPKFTPTEWYNDEDKFSRAYDPLNGSRILCTLHDFDTEANKALILAAPDLYHALDNLVTCLTKPLIGGMDDLLAAIDAADETLDIAVTV